MKSKPALAAALAAVLVIGGCEGDDAATAPALVGQWRSAVQFKTGAFASVTNLELMLVFNFGGTMTESSNYDAMPPVPPAYGIWRSVGLREFEAKYEFYMSQATAGADEMIQAGGWPPSGRGVLVERITLSPDGESFTSTMRYEAFDLQGQPSDDTGGSVGRGVRLAF